MHGLHVNASLYSCSVLNFVSVKEVRRFESFATYFVFLVMFSSRFDICKEEKD